VGETKMQWSEHQLAIFDNVESGTGNLEVNAVAGSGKTTTITHSMTRIPAGKKVLFVAFNKHIADALQQKIANMSVACSVQAMTLNSFGWRAAMSALTPRS
jgi:superfamily I DNA/RNA helicase